jgi:carboxylesterase
MAGTEPFTRDAGDGADAVGVLILHGFTGSPKSVRPWAEHLASAGLSVRLPRLPGHGTTVQDANRSGWSDWYGEAERAFAELDRMCSAVFVAGLSMGGALALRLAEQHPDRVGGLVLVNPAVHSENRLLPLLPVLRHVVPSVPGIGNDIAKPGQDEACYGRLPVRAFHSLVAGWREVKADIANVTAPLLVFRSRTDHVVEPSNTRWVLDHVASADVSEHVLERSFHVATLDHDAPTIFAETVRFIRRLAPQASHSAPAPTVVEREA